MGIRILQTCLFAGTACVLAWIAAPSQATAQDAVVACHTQQQIEQLVRDKGQIMPDGCRNIWIRTVNRPTGDLCVLDISQTNGGITGAIVEATTDTQWWVRCRDLERR
ncbi:hypothetical protein [Azospirillum sp. Sh1]|uniref:hypothetical protein n=1 Tax=Azospirillum sp. Sh1 TaxID=2607285 RepID=UPI0011EC2653|nr:hypothetical protein [Azospirillum sp. Sh1]KAA0574528.1 hypothetical protein FZ029_18390 [Azospirillum sp. Sh1]